HGVDGHVDVARGARPPARPRAEQIDVDWHRGERLAHDLLHPVEDGDVEVRREGGRGHASILTGSALNPALVGGARMAPGPSAVRGGPGSADGSDPVSRT